MSISCETSRELLSSLADGEANSSERAAAADHLSRCEGCRDFRAQMDTLNRSVRVRAATPIPDFTATVLAAAQPPTVGKGEWIRVGLGACAFAIVARSLPLLVFANMSGSSVHVARHLGAFNVALGLGLAFAAWQPQRAYGLVPFAAALVTTMMGGALLDILDSNQSPLVESAHILEVLGLGFLWMLAGLPGAPHGWRRRLGTPRIPVMGLHLVESTQQDTGLDHDGHSASGG